jgi:hypothetical protein
MGENIITWNVTNWVTIVLMSFLGFAVLAVLGQLFRASRSSDDQASTGG